MAKKVIYKTGDVFSIEVAEKEFIFGRVLFDVTKQYLSCEQKDKLNYLSFFNKCLLVETYIGVYSNVNEVNFEQTVNFSTFVSDDFHKQDFFKERNCKVIDFREIDVKKVTFPENLSSYNSTYYFSVGELYLPIVLNSEEYDEIKVHPSFGYGYWEIIVATLDISKREDLIEEGDNKKNNYFRWSDLRSMPDIRNKIYALAGEDPNQSYYEMALKHGFDLARFY
jgi:hypothetical protein